MDNMVEANGKTNYNGKSSEDSKPLVGMEFASIEDVKEFYKAYGRNNGSMTRKRSSYATKKGEGVSRVVFVCSNEGIHNKDFDPDEEGNYRKKRNTSTMRTDCKAMICIAFDGRFQVWYINEFIEEHNHVMVSPKKRMLMRSNKHMPHEAKSLAEAFNKSRIPVGKVAALFGQSESIGFDTRDVYNHLRNVRKSLLDVGDAEALVSCFRRKTLENPSFYYAFQVDDEGRAANVFWVHARSRIAYSRFGDAVSFDSTYKTNKYSMPFAPFTGTNHHRQSVTFGFALLGDETKETYT
ncbi:protein FAR1-RELATED SEQUENCE 5-like [Papaver somniferum]|uniref:protein FAR1-RELATED SEQUENCE 5-like n=1 Tax=Papaver somniferum TaxID=3469 RepID=UPI000E6FE532|nr:protein FAR1-RELATED SEQUENCE 5-like [Papaver somniferum]